MNRFAKITMRLFFIALISSFLISCGKADAPAQDQNKNQTGGATPTPSPLDQNTGIELFTSFCSNVGCTVETVLQATVILEVQLTNGWYTLGELNTGSIGDVKIIVAPGTYRLTQKAGTNAGKTANPLTAVVTAGSFQPARLRYY